MCDCEGAFTNGLGLGFFVPEGSTLVVFKSVLTNVDDLRTVFEEFGKPDVDGNETDGCEAVEVLLCSSVLPGSLWSSSTTDS